METINMNAKMIALLKKFDDELKAMLATDLAVNRTNQVVLQPVPVSSLKIVR